MIGDNNKSSSKISLKPALHPTPDVLYPGADWQFAGRSHRFASPVNQ